MRTLLQLREIAAGTGTGWTVVSIEELNECDKEITHLHQRVKELEDELEDVDSAWKHCRSYILGLNAKIKELEADNAK